MKKPIDFITNFKSLFHPANLPDLDYSEGKISVTPFMRITNVVKVLNVFLFPDEGLSLGSREILKSPQIRLPRIVLIALIGKFIHLCL